MKTNLKIASMIIFAIFISACDKADDIVQESEMTSQDLSSNESASSSKKSSVINQTYDKAQQEVIETFQAIAQTITDGAGKGYDSEYMDQLISFHAYGPKFTEFNDGKSYDSAGNEVNERTFFGEDLEEDGVIQFATIDGTLKVAVYYGNVANLTFTSDFILMHKEYGKITVNNLITLLFVKTNGKWKMVHEHHSPLKQ